MDNDDRKALVLIDESNIYYGLKKSGWELDYYKFYEWLKKEFNPTEVILYGGIISKKTFMNRKQNNTFTGFLKAKAVRESFLRKLKEFGYKIISKPVESIYDSTSGNFKNKCNFDVEITIDAIDKINNYSELVLCSGDGDFVKLGKYVKGKFRKFTVIGQKDRLNSRLIQVANRTLFLGEIRSLVEKKKELP